MSKLQIQKVQLPDGTCVTIEGGDAESTARFLFNHYLERGITISKFGPAEVEPLIMPTINWREASAAGLERCAAPATEVRNGEVEPLPLPTWPFSRK
jgi:hypothetical protein